MAVALVAATVLATTAMAASPAKSDQAGTTVGEFTIRLAKTLKLPNPQGGFQADSARAALWKAGVKVSADTKKSLTEGDVIAALSQMGFTLTTEDPSRVVTTSRADAILTTFVNSEAVRGRNLGAGLEVVDDDFNNGNGKGGKFKRKNDKSPTGTGDD